jgi:hypothetical protein
MDATSKSPPPLYASATVAGVKSVFQKMTRIALHHKGRLFKEMIVLMLLKKNGFCVHFKKHHLPALESAGKALLFSAITRAN